MRLFYYFLIVAFFSGQLISITLSSGIRLVFMDLAVTGFIFFYLFINHFHIKNLIKYIRVFGPFILTAIISLIFQFINLPLFSVLVASLYLIRFCLYTLVTIFIFNTREVRNISLFGLWIGGLTIAFLGLVQYFLYPNLRNLSYLGWDPHQFRLFSTLLDPNFTGIILVLTFILTYYLPVFTKVRFLKSPKFKIPILFFVLITLLLTYSRGSLISFLAVLFLGAIKAKKYLHLLVMLTVIGTTIFLLPKPAGEGVNLGRIISIESRIENSREGLNLFIKHPILGVGFNTLKYSREKLPLSPNSVSRSAFGFHNSWLLVLTTTGIIGFMSFLWIWREIIINNLKNHLLLLSLAAVFIHSFVDNSLFYPQVMFWMSVVIGNSNLFKETA